MAPQGWARGARPPSQPFSLNPRMAGVGGVKGKGKLAEQRDLVW